MECFCQVVKCFVKLKTRIFKVLYGFRFLMFGMICSI